MASSPPPCVRSGFFFLAFLALVLPHPCLADCSCTIGSNGIYIIGFEMTATQCPVTPFSDTRTYVYLVSPIRCNGTTFDKYASYGDTMASPQQLISYYVNNGYRVIRNESGTHLLIVQRGTYPFTGSVSGVSMATAAPGVYFSTPVTSMDRYCSEKPLPDQDQDGIPDCLDLPEIDARFNLGPPPCPITTP